MEKLPAQITFLRTQVVHVAAGLGQPSEAQSREVADSVNDAVQSAITKAIDDLNGDGWTVDDVSVTHGPLMIGAQMHTLTSVVARGVKHG